MEPVSRDAAGLPDRHVRRFLHLSSYDHGRAPGDQSSAWPSTDAAMGDDGPMLYSVVAG